MIKTNIIFGSEFMKPFFSSLYSFQHFLIHFFFLISLFIKRVKEQNIERILIFPYWNTANQANGIVCAHTGRTNSLILREWKNIYLKLCCIFFLVINSLAILQVCRMRQNKRTFMNCIEIKIVSYCVPLTLTVTSNNNVKNLKRRGEKKMN